jgi:hypothetical protein
MSGQLDDLPDQTAVSEVDTIKRTDCDHSLMEGW